MIIQYLNIIKNAFISGLFLIIPAYVTIIIIKKIIIFTGEFLLEIEQYLFFLKIDGIPHSPLIILAILICIGGYFIKKKTNQIIISLIEKKIISKMPLIKNIYQGTKKILEILKTKSDTHQEEASNKVAWVKIPNLNTYSIGFFVGQLELKYAPEKNKAYFSFFIPTTPNPITGYYIIAAENEFFFNDMTRQEALAIIISGGIIRPDEK